MTDPSTKDESLTQELEMQPTTSLDDSDNSSDEIDAEL